MSHYREYISLESAIKCLRYLPDTPWCTPRTRRTGSWPQAWCWAVLAPGALQQKPWMLLSERIPKAQLSPAACPSTALHQNTAIQCLLQSLRPRKPNAPHCIAAPGLTESPVMHNLVLFLSCCWSSHCLQISMSNSHSPNCIPWLPMGKSKRPDSRLVMAVRQRKRMMGGRRRGCAVPCGSQPDAPSLSLLHMTAAQSRLEESSTPCSCSHTLFALIQSV